jgi:hypothetical protein
MRIMRDGALLLCIPLSNAVTVCTFKKILGLPTTKRRPPGTVTLSCDEGAAVSENW